MSALLDKTRISEREMYDKWSQAFNGVLHLPYNFTQASSQTKLSQRIER
jgi:hypothetical protein